VAIPERLLAAIRSGKCVLFLGAGANYHCLMSLGEKMPTGNKLSEMLSLKFGVRKANTLAETAELVEACYTRRDLNAYLIELFINAIPSTGFKLISTFRWPAIFTTNYDTLLETVYAKADALQKAKVYYTSNQQMDLGPQDVPIYKLHGCILRADTIEGRLVITPDDYADYRRNRSRLFNRLADLLADKPFLYLGYGRQDSDFRQILADVHREMRGDVPEGYALSPGKNPEDDLVWGKKGVTLIDVDVDDFLVSLDTSMPGRTIVELPKLNFPLAKQYENIDRIDLRETLSYFQLPIPPYGERINASSFFKGSEALWKDLQSGVDAQRDIYDDVMANLLEDAVSIEQQGTAYCILAEAGAGKSTLLRRMAYDLCHDFQQVVFWYQGERRIPFDILKSINKVTGQRVFIFVDRASKFVNNLESIRRDCLAGGIPLTIVAADRTNEWHYAGGSSLKLTRNWVLEKLSDAEINSIITKLNQFNCLGNLKDLTNRERLRRFKEYSDRQLLVALREATEGKDFDQLIVDEYEGIPDAIARAAYFNICALTAFGRGIRTSALARSMAVNLSDLGNILQMLEGLISYGDDIYKARHATIAKIVLLSIGQETRISVLEQLISRLDLGYSSDFQVFKSLETDEQLIGSLGDIDTRRRLFAALKNICPDDPYIQQHEARMEIRSMEEGGSLERAERLIRSALKLSNDAIVIRHTAGILYQKRAQFANGLEKQSYFSKAVDEFTGLVRRAPTSDYVWVSLVETRIQLGQVAEKDDVKFSHLSRAESDFQKALENCGYTPYILRSKAKLEAAWGHGDTAREYYQKAISGPTAPVELFANYIRWELRNHNVPLAREAAERAVVLYRTIPEILVLRARTMLLGNGWKITEIVPLLLDAQRTSVGYTKIEAHFWHAVSLWEDGQYYPSLEQFKFSRVAAASLGRSDVKYIRYVSKLTQNAPITYTGKIIERGPRSSWILVNPGNVRVFVNPRLLEGATGDTLQIKIGFNWLGPIAIIPTEQLQLAFEY
jgi:tetratricopeptide (TPR) repeat protein